MKKLIILICIIFVLATFVNAQACGWGRGQISVFNEKSEPIKNFKIVFYELRGFDWSNKKKITRVELSENGWDIFLTESVAEDFIKNKEPFSYSWDDDREVVFYKENTYNYRTLENAGNTVLVKISAKEYENFYFISPVFLGCYYYNKITMKKKQEIK